MTKWMIISIILYLWISVNICVHEGGHILYYLLCGVGIKAVAIRGYVFIHNSDKWKIVKTRERKESLVVPIISDSKTIREYEQIVIKDLLAGPAATLIMNNNICSICRIPLCTSDILHISNDGGTIKYYCKCKHSFKCVFLYART